MDIKQESQVFGHIVASKDQSAFHRELMHIRQLDSRNGTLDLYQFRKDLAAIEEQLQASGLLPDFRILLTEERRLATSNDPEHKNISAGGEQRDHSDRINFAPAKLETTGAKLYELRHLSHRTGDHSSPDAMVLVPPNFDPNKPIHLVVYDHGFYDTAKSAYEKAHLAEQMANASPNTVLIVPEWQRVPGSQGAVGSDQGRYREPGFVEGMVQEIFNKTPELQNKTLSDVDHVSIISHSAGYIPAESQLKNNGQFSEKVSSVTLLDSLYDSHGFDDWIRKNINDLSDGKKQFHCIFNQHSQFTSPYSKQLATRIRQWLREANRSERCMDAELNTTESELHETCFAEHPIVIRSTLCEHMQIPTKYPAHAVSMRTVSARKAASRV